MFQENKKETLTQENKFLQWSNPELICNKNNCLFECNSNLSNVSNASNTDIELQLFFNKHGCNKRKQVALAKRLCVFPKETMHFSTS
jgi:hypothetical protein